MLLRTASTRIFNPWKPHFKESLPETEIVHQFPKSRPLTLSASSKLLPPQPMVGGPAIMMMQTLSESDNLSIVAKRTPRMAFLDGGLCCGVDEVGESSDSGGEMVSVLIGVGFSRNGCSGDGNGSGSDGGNDGCFGSLDSDSEDDKTDSYYLRMIKTNPTISLLVSNYHQFLKEDRGDLIKAEEYWGRAMSANPNEGSVVSIYADLIWSNHKDASRAESYHLQATKLSPEDSFVLAAYARFLWESE